MLTPSPSPFIAYPYLPNFETQTKPLQNIAKVEEDFKKLFRWELFLENHPYLKAHQIIWDYGNRKTKTMPINYISSSLANAKGTFLILPDYGEILENYSALFQNLNHRNYAIMAFDWPGQGIQQNYKKKRLRSDYFSSKKDIALLQFILTTLLYPDYKGPFYVLGHGMGSLIALAAQNQLSALIKAFIHVAPIFSCYGYEQKTSFSCYCHIMKHLGCGWKRNNHLKRKYHSFYEQEQHEKHLNAPSFAFMSHFFKLLEKIYAPKFFTHNNAVNLFFYGDQDIASPAKIVKDYADHLPLACTIEIKKGGHYFIQKKEQNLLNKQFFSGLEAFLEN